MLVKHEMLLQRHAAHKIESMNEEFRNIWSAQPKPRNGQLLHIVDRLNTSNLLTEPAYNIQIDAVALRRRVQLYQWIETLKFV